MSKIVHVSHDTQPEAHQPHGPRPRRLLARPRFWAALAGSVCLFMIAFGLMFHYVRRVPNDARVDAQLAQAKRQMQARRAERDRSRTVAGVADTIVQAQAGRRAQEAWLKDDSEADVIAP